MRVLLIEDDHATAQSIELMLKSEGFNVYTTDLGEEGIDLGKIYDYDLILLDLNLKHESLLIRGDEQLIRVAILNLMDNGCKYSDDGHILINLHSKNQGFILIEFINNGAGIEEGNRDRIFQPFFRGKNNKKTKGFGIGLSLVSHIVALHNGFITVDSVPHKETKFTVRFPVPSSQ